MNLDKKIISVKALDVDPGTKRVKVAISQMEDVDRDNDVFAPYAWDKSIKENGPKGSNEVWHLLDHTPKSFSALSKFTELYKEGKYLVGISNYKNSFAWREVAWPLYEAGDITQHSVGFETLKDKERDNKGIRVITEAKLYEGSAVLWGAQPDTPTMQIVKSLLNTEDDREITAAEKLEEIIRKMSKEREGFTHEDQSLLLIELKRLQTLFDIGQVAKIFEPSVSSLKTSEPEIKSTPAEEPEPTSTLPDIVKETLYMPDVVECPNCGKHTLNTQKIKDHIKCHLCKAVFTYGSKLFVHI